MRRLCYTLIFTLIFCGLNAVTQASLRLDRVPPPPSPGGCLIGGIMYTGYIRTIYMGRTGTAPNETVTGYRYQYDSAGPRQNCYVGRTNFIGPDPNATGNTPIADIGCGFSPNYNPNTTSTSVFTIVACPIDDYTPWLILPIGIFGFYYMRKGSFTG